MRFKRKTKNALAILPILLLAQLPLIIGMVQKENAAPQGLETSLKAETFVFNEGTVADIFESPVLEAEDVKASKIEPQKEHTPTTKSSLEYDQRITQAKELLGKHYKKSVVRKGEKVKNVDGFVKNQVRELVKKDKFKSSRKKIASAILRESKKHGFDPIFLMSVIQNESTFDPEIRGSFGEIGLMQIKPTTAEWISKKLKIKYKGEKDLFNPVKNIEIGSAYLAYLRGRFKSHSRLYISAYNMGATNVNRALDKQIWPKDYVSKVMNFYVQHYTELAQPTLVTQN